MRATRLALCALVIAAAIAALAAPALAGDETTFEIPVNEKLLDNGLKVLVVENPTAQTVSCRLVYRVGSANEQPGLTGLAHFFEHLMFKGTRRIGVKDLEADARLMEQIDAVAAKMRAIRLRREKTPADEARLAELGAELDALILKQRDVVEKNETMEVYRKAGGTGINASTGRDMTQYQVTLPANKLELFMWMESDRLANAVFREFYAEKDVVREERRLSENRPTYAFNEALNQIVYGSHPYAWPVVGYHEDLVNATREDAKDFFATFYVPDNAIMVLVGNVSADEAFALAQKYFGPIPRGTRRRPVIPNVAPKPVGERRLLARAKTQPMVDLTYYRKPFGDPDEAVYEVIAGILSGSSGRFEQTVVREQNLATGVGASARPSRYICTFGVSGTTKGETTPEQLLAAIDAQLARLRTEDVSEQELQKVKNATRARVVQILQRDGFLSMVLGSYEVMGDWRALNRSIRAIDAVTAADVRRVANELLVPENRVVGLLHGLDDQPVAAANAATPAPAPAPAIPDAAADRRDVAAHPDRLTYPERAFEPPAPSSMRVVLPSGLRVYIREDRRLPTVSITASFAGGSLHEPAERTGLAAATGQLMKRGGTAELDEDALDARLDLLAARISSGIGETSGSVSLSCFDRDLDECLGYFRDVLRAPAFRADRLERWKEEALQAIARRNDSPRSVSRREFDRALYGDHPSARLRSPESVGAIARDDLVAFHRRLVTPRNTILSVAGNFETEAMLRKIKAVLGDWEGAAPELTAPPAPSVEPTRGVRFIEMDSSQGYVSVGHLGMKRDHADHDAMSVLNAVLRRRIFNRVRTDEGLAYSAYSNFSAPDLYPGVTGAGFQSKSESVAFALQLVFEELRRARDELIPADELEGVKQGLIDAFPGRFSSAESIVSLYAGRELRGRPMDELATYRDRIAAITAEQLQRAAREHLHPERMTIQIVGDKEAILAGDGVHEAKVTDFGPIVDVPLEAPPVAKKQTPRTVVETAFATLKAGDVEGFIACFAADVRARLEERREALAAGARNPMLSAMSVEVKDEFIDGDTAKVEVVLVMEIGEQKREMPRTLRLTREGEAWRLTEELAFGGRRRR